MSGMTEEKAAALRKAFPKSAVGILPKPYKKDSPKSKCVECGGYHGMPAVHLDYVGHAATTDRLLSVDPEWSWEPVGVDQYGNPQPDAAGNLWIRLTVCGVTRLGVGDGSSMKERIGDAIRNAAMRFGVALDLWSKEELEQGHDVEKAVDKKATRSKGPTPEDDPWLDNPPAPAGSRQVTKAQLGKIGAAMKELGITEREGALLYVKDVIGREVESRNDLTTAEASKVIEALERDKEQPFPSQEPSP